jgi:hypothetical protein
MKGGAGGAAAGGVTTDPVAVGVGIGPVGTTEPDVDRRAYGEADGYERIAAIADRLLVAAGTGDAELLEHLITDWDATVASLPAAPTRAAGPALARAAAAHAQLGVVLRAARDRVGDELARGATGRRTAAGYGAGASTAAAAGVVAEHRA